MEFAITILLILIAIAIAMVVGYSSRIRASNGTIRRLADAYHGSFQPVGWFDRTGPTANFSHTNGSLVTVQFVMLNTKSASRSINLQVVSHDLALAYQVVPKRWSRRIAALLRTGVLKTGSPQFDRDFLVRAVSSRVDVCRQLDANVQACVYRLSRMPGLDDVRMKWSEGTLAIQGHGQVYDDHRLGEFVRLGLNLFDSAAETSLGGITFVESHRDAVASHATPGDHVDLVNEATFSVQSDKLVHGDALVCPLCHGPLEGRVVNCRQCRTPHHQECWRFHGACSIYGCGERRYTRSSRQQRSTRA